MNTLAASQADLRRMFQAGNVRYLIMGINLLLVVWIAAEAAALTWSVLQPDAGDAPVAAVKRPVPVAAAPGRQLLARLPDWHLMGEAVSKPATVKTAVPAEAPDTRLRLTLRGALSSDNPSGGHAIIADDKGKDERYSIGDTLPGNAELSEIYPDRVILKRGGRYETLRLPDLDSLTSRPGRARHRENPQEKLSAVRQQLRNDPSSSMNLIKVVPFRDDSGQVIGYTVSPGKNPILFADSGLQDGDVVIQVNGMNLSVPSNGAKALQLLKSKEPIDLVVMRNGIETPLRIGGS